MENKIPSKFKVLKCVFYALTVALILLSCTPKVVGPTPDEAKIAVMEQITKAAEQWSTGNPLGYVDCAASDIVWIDVLGAQEPVIGSEALRNYLGTFKDQVPHHKFELLDPIFQVYDDIVIVTYRYLGTFEGVPGDPWKITSVYRFVNGEWLSVHENWSEVKEEPIAE